jgi:hypothetical protein
VSPETTSLIIAAVTFIASIITSVGSAMFIAGNRWGEVRTDMRVMADRLAKIEGMFTLKLKDPSDGA